jgi:hypothetical protein
MTGILSQCLHFFILYNVQITLLVFTLMQIYYIEFLGELPK